jgi:hypothetical protein
MRVIACMLATFTLAAPALADGWKEYRDPTYAFAVSFPGDPKVETTTYAAADGQVVAARVYSVTQDGGAFTMMIADLSDTGLAEQAVIDNAVKTLARDGEIKLNIPARVSRVFGRQLSILGADGSRSSVALFYYAGRLYQIEGKSLAAGNGTADAIRFQQSLIFTDNGANGPAGERGPRDRGDRGDRGQRRERRDREVQQPL